MDRRYYPEPQTMELWQVFHCDSVNLFGGRKDSSGELGGARTDTFDLYPTN